MKIDRTMQKPATQIEYGNFQTAFDWFNRELFNGELPPPYLTIVRKSHSAGYFGPDRFTARQRKATVSEIALNPDGFIGHTDEQILQTLVHEMVHSWQHAKGTAPRRAYHNKEWSAKMKLVGLYPSSTGMVGGRETGQRMSDYIIPGGKFAVAYAKLKRTGFKLNWQSSVRSNNAKPPVNKQNQIHLQGV